jgi:hypothetical protein
MTAAFRFAAKVRIEPSGCWIWMGARNSRGYGLFTPVTVGPRRYTSAAHRYSYSLLVGQIPDGLQIDHLCRVPSCVNPDHLEPVTPLENSRRGRKGVLYDFCIQGHEMTADNTLHHNTKAGQTRRCRRCQVLANRAYRLRKKRSITPDRSVA